jgi:hypothetical protein
VALVTGGILGYETSVTLDELRSTPQVESRSLVRKHRNLAIAADTAFAATGGGLLLWGASWFFD